MIVAAAALAFACVAPEAVDGDALRCRGMGLVRLQGIDAPELPGHCRRGRSCTPGDGAASQAALARLIARRRVTCEPVARDFYGRLLAECRVGPVPIACAMISAGQAVVRYGTPACLRR